MEIFNLLCSQAAISMENAGLYEQSQQALFNLQQAQLQLVQSEKMSVLGNLVAGVAHEINNLIGFIVGNLKLALDYVLELFGPIELYQGKMPHPPPEIEVEIDRPANYSEKTRRGDRPSLKIRQRHRIYHFSSFRLRD